MRQFGGACGTKRSVPLCMRAERHSGQGSQVNPEANWIMQVHVLSLRFLRSWYRCPVNLAIQGAQYIFFALLIGEAAAPRLGKPLQVMLHGLLPTPSAMPCWLKQGGPAVPAHQEATSRAQFWPVAGRATALVVPLRAHTDTGVAGRVREG